MAAVLTPPTMCSAPHFAMQTKVKLLVLGDQGAGKTTLAQRLTSEARVERSGDEGACGSDAVPRLPPPLPTVGVDFLARAVQLDAESWPLRLNLWDTSGQPRFRSLAEGCMRELRAHDAAVIVYDLTRRSTFDAVTGWAEMLRQAAQDAPVIVLLGNKADLEAERAVSAEEGQQLAETLGAAFFAETGRGAAPGSVGDMETLLRRLLTTHCCTLLPGAPARSSSGLGEEVAPRRCMSVLPRRCLSPTTWLQPVLRCAVCFF